MQEEGVHADRAPEKTALIVVDVQNDFAHIDGKAALWGADMTPVQPSVHQINRLIVAARAFGAMIVYACMEHSPQADPPDYHTRYARQPLDPTDVLCSAGSWGAAFYAPMMSPRPTDLILTKAGYDAFEDTVLNNILRDRQVETLVVVGLSTHFSVQMTAEQGFGLGYGITVVSDATAGDDVPTHEAALHRLGQGNVAVVTADELITSWQRAAQRVPRRVR